MTGPTALTTCDACWLGAHVSCSQRACACADPLHDDLHKDEGPRSYPEPFENRAGSSAQKAG